MANLLSQNWFIALMSITLIGAVLSAVHHAEIIAHNHFKSDSYITETLGTPETPRDVALEDLSVTDFPLRLGVLVPDSEYNDRFQVLLSVTVRICRN